MSANGHEFAQLSLIVEIRCGSLLEQGNSLLPMLRRHSQLLHEIFHVGYLILRDATVCLGKFAHHDENRSDENGLSIGACKRINSTRAICDISVDDTANHIAEQRAQKAKEVKTQQGSDYLEQGIFLGWDENG